eukprot:379667-Hanusia_phi.AAC.2
MRLELLKAHYLLGLQEPQLSLVSSSLGPPCYNRAMGTLDLSLRTSDIKRHIAEDLRIQSLPAWIAKLDPPLRVIDVSGNPNLARLPVEELCGMRALQQICCSNCVKLILPPPEIAAQGGGAVMTYLRKVRDDGEPNKRMSLILIGHGEAGKTSVLRALKSQHDRAGRIDADEGRTIGIDLHLWEPEDNDGLTFDVMDFGGQAVYGKTNQYFIVRRALYVLVWNVRRGKKTEEDSDTLMELKAMISYWIRAIQARVPGAVVMLVATHIDLAENEEFLQQQCDEVKKSVEYELKKMSEEGQRTISPLHVLNNGESFQVNCLSGDGIAELRKSVREAAKGLLWWNEIIPRTFLRLKEEVITKSHEDAVIDMNEYISLVKVAEVKEGEVEIATRMLHEMGVLKYFGSDMRAGQNRDKTEKQRYSFEDTVFIDPAWMIQVFKGVMRHDWGHLLNASKDDPKKSKKVKKMLHLGIIDEDLLKDLWQLDKLGEKEKPSEADKRIDVQQAVALLRGCDLAHFMGAGGRKANAAVLQQSATRELLCPGIIPHFTHQHKQAVRNRSSLCEHMTREYNIFPAGFIDRLVVRCASRHLDVDCSGRMAVMKGWGRMLVVSWSSDEGEHTLVADASTRKQIENLEEDLKALQAFFPGMHQRHENKGSSGSEAVHIGIFSCGKESARYAKDIQDDVRGIHDAQKLPLALTCKTHDCQEMTERPDDMFLVHMLCISTECLDDQGRVRSDNSFSQLWNELIASKSIIIPVVLQDYYEKHISGPKNFSKWWPEGIQGMERYKIFHLYEKEEASKRRLYEMMMMKLYQGQGSYEDLLEVTNQNQLLCQDCLYESSASSSVEYVSPAQQQHTSTPRSERDIGTFDRSEVSNALEEMRRGKASDLGLEVEIRCTRLHSRQIKEVLEFNNSVSPCPSCLKAAKLPNFFSRPVCLSMLARDLTAKIVCERCDKEVDVLDVVPPQIFLSYQWGHDKSTQQMVRKVKQKIEERTSLQCWFDVEGGINAGEDHVAKMDVGVSRCELFVAFLSDMYVKSANCRREFRRACETNKCIIPVFVPVLFQGDESASGWQGSKARGWWTAIDKADGEGSEVGVDWTHLRSFPNTLDLKAEKKGDDIEISNLDELVAAVQARTYRGTVIFHEVMHVICATDEESHTSDVVAAGKAGKIRAQRANATK